MPKRLRVCAEEGCPELGYETRCEKHAREHNRAREAAGKWSRHYEVYRDPRWRALRAQVRREQIGCARSGCVEDWVDLDHIVALEDGGEPFDRANVMGLCKRHHTQKTLDERRSREQTGKASVRSGTDVAARPRWPEGEPAPDSGRPPEAAERTPDGPGPRRPFDRRDGAGSWMVPGERRQWRRGD